MEGLFGPSLDTEHLEIKCLVFANHGDIDTGHAQFGLLGIALSALGILSLIDLGFASLGTPNLGNAAFQIGILVLYNLQP